MRRVLFLSALMSLGGCWCFDAKYMEFCRETGKCDGGVDAGPEPFGNVTRIELREVPNSLEAGLCARARVEFINQDSAVTAANRAGSVQLATSPGVHVFATAGCMGQGITSVPFGPNEDGVQFWFNAEYFGPMAITATVGSLAPFQTNFLSTAVLRIVPAPVAVSSSMCRGAFTVEAWSPSTASAVKAAAALAVDVDSPGLSFGPACSMPGTTQVTIPAFAAFATVFARMTSDGGAMLSAYADDTAGLLGAPQTQVYPDCLPNGVACGGLDCCPGLSCMAGFCGM